MSSTIHVLTDHNDSRAIDAFCGQPGITCANVSRGQILEPNQNGDLGIVTTPSGTFEIPPGSNSSIPYEYDGKYCVMEKTKFRNTAPLARSVLNTVQSMNYKEHEENSNDSTDSTATFASAHDCKQVCDKLNDTSFTNGVRKCGGFETDNVTADNLTCRFFNMNRGKHTQSSDTRSVYYKCDSANRDLASMNDFSGKEDAKLQDLLNTFPRKGDFGTCKIKNSTLHCTMDPNQNNANFKIAAKALHKHMKNEVTDVVYTGTDAYNVSNNLVSESISLTLKDNVCPEGYVRKYGRFHNNHKFGYSNDTLSQAAQKCSNPSTDENNPSNECVGFNFDVAGENTSKPFYTEKYKDLTGFTTEDHNDKLSCIKEESLWDTTNDVPALVPKSEMGVDKVASGSSQTPYNHPRKRIRRRGRLYDVYFGPVIENHVPEYKLEGLAECDVSALADIASTGRGNAPQNCQVKSYALKGSEDNDQMMLQMNGHHMSSEVQYLKENGKYLSGDNADADLDANASVADWEAWVCGNICKQTDNCNAYEYKRDRNHDGRSCKLYHLSDTVPLTPDNFVHDDLSMIHKVKERTLSFVEKVDQDDTTIISDVGLRPSS
jgi:predicted transposase YbfD/YdcC